MPTSGPGLERERGNEGSLYKTGFSCIPCGHHRTVMISRENGKAVDFEDGSDFRKGKVYAIPMTVVSSGNQGLIIQAVAEAHQQHFHPDYSGVDVKDVRN